MSLMPFSGRLFRSMARRLCSVSWGAMGSHWKGVPALGTKGEALRVMRMPLPRRSSLSLMASASLTISSMSASVSVGRPTMK